MSRIRRFLSVLVAAIALPAGATTHSTDYTDLWYRGESESGWGVNVIQQGDIIFATFFIYGPDNTPRWYVAPDVRSVAAPPGENLFSGPLYSTMGTYFGAPWAGTQPPTLVGSVAFSFVSPTQGAVSYTISNVPVTKSIVRQTWRGNTMTGNYIGGLAANGTGCRNGVNNGTILINGELTVGHSNFFSPAFRIDFANANGAPGVCTFSGGYAQEGKLGRVSNGTWSCQIQGVPNPPVGTFTLTQIEANTNGLTARFAGSDQNCNYDGFFGGFKDVL